MATKFTKDGTDGTIAFAVREFLPQGFSAPGWTDLRVGFLVSVCPAADVDPASPITGLTETIGTEPRPLLDSSDRYFIGVLDRVTGQTFLGFSNRSPGRTERTMGTSRLVSSDAGIGTSNSDFWRPENGVNTAASLQIVDNHATRAFARDGSQIHFVQNVTNAGGYATLLMLRLQRQDAQGRAKTVSVSTKCDVVNHSGDILFTNTPTEDLLETNLQTMPDTVQLLGPVELSQEPSAIYVYWPFHDSRIRLHCHGILRAG